MIGISLLTPNFLKPGNLSNILAQTAVIAIVALGQHLVILTRGIDLSVGANLALATVIGGLVFRVADSAPLVMLAMLLSGALVGAVNGMVFVFGRLPHPFIITLATLSICRGLALEFAPGHTTMRGMPDFIAFIGGADDASGVPNSFFVVFGVVALVLDHGALHGVGPLDLCGRRQAGSGPADGHPGQMGAGLGLCHLGALRRDRRHHPVGPDGSQLRRSMATCSSSTPSQR